MTERFRPLLGSDNRVGDARIERVIGGFARRRASSAADTPGDLAHWDARFFGLEGTALFAQASAEMQRRVLQVCCEQLLWESWYIEQCGIAFCARMVLLAEEVAAREVYSMIGADEATHAHWISGWLPRNQNRPADPFNHFVAGLVENGDAQPLRYVLQIVLEGFGIRHYRSLADGCRHPALAQTLRTMMSDEGLHHAGGVATFDAERLDKDARAFALAATTGLVQMIRVGPQAVASALSAAIGGLDKRGATNLFDALGCETTIAPKLATLRELIAQPGMGWLVDELDRLRMFTPCTAEECAQVFAAG